MTCPQCHMEQDDGNLVCDYCRVVFAKLGVRDTQGQAPATTGARFTRYAASDTKLGALLFAPASPAGPVALAGRALLLVVLAIWGVRLMSATIESNAIAESFLHLVNLPFHEAGHVFFSPFGDFVHSLGGTLGQLLMPLICGAVLLVKTRDPFGAAVSLWWFGENFLDMAPYIDDARAGQLPLLGGNTGETSPYGFHDWQYLLGETGLLRRDHVLAHASQSIGTAVMTLALLWALAVLVNGYRRRGAVADRHARGNDLAA